MSDAKARLKARLKSRPAAGALPGGRKALPAAERFKKAAEEDVSAPLYVFLAYDKTGSMSSYIGAVQDNIATVAKEVFDQEEGIEAAVWAVGDHTDGPGWLEKNDPTNNYQELKRQIDSIQPTHGGDAPEAYECAWNQLARYTSDLKGENPGVK